LLPFYLTSRTFSWRVASALLKHYDPNVTRMQLTHDYGSGCEGLTRLDYLINGDV